MDVLFIIISLVVLAIEISMVVFLSFKIKRYHRLTLKDTIVYPVVILLSIVTLIIAKSYYLEESGFNVIASSLKDSVSIVALSINTNVFDGLLHHSALASKFILAIYIGEYIVSALALLSISISLLHVSFCNIVRKCKNLLSTENKEVDYILGFNDDAKEYVKAYYKKYVEDSKFKNRYHRLVVLLDSSVLKNFENEKFFLHKYKTSYSTRPYSYKKDIIKTIKRLTFGKRTKRIITFIDDDKQNFLFVNEALNYVDKHNDNVKFIIVANTSQGNFLKNIIYEFDSNKGMLDKSKGRINIFNKHDLISLEFIKNHNFAKYFPKEYVNKDLTITDCDINVYMFGFGNVNQALLRDILITNQFVQKEKIGDNYKLLPKRMNVEVYESKLKIESLELFNGILKYNKSKYDNPDRFLELPEDYISYVKLNSNVSIYEDKFINELFNRIKEKANSGKKQINYFIISLDSDFVNCNVAKRLKSNFDHIEGTRNTYFIRLKEDLYDIEENIVSFGKTKDVLSYDNIVGNHIYDIANLFHYYYEDKKDYAKESTPIEFKSNFYNVASLYFKLSLLYLLKDDNDKYDIDTLKKLMDKYKLPNEFKQIKINETKTNFYDSLCDDSTNELFDIRDVFAFIEHERWNAYELSQGALPMSKEYCEKQLKNICESFINKKQEELSKLFCKYDKEKNNYIIKFNKTIDELYHFCITTNHGLKEYYFYISKIFSEYIKKYNLTNITANADVIFYDYKYMDVVKKDILNGCEMKVLYDELNEFLSNEN